MLHALPTRWGALPQATRLWRALAEASSVWLAQVSRQQRAGCGRPATELPTAWLKAFAPASARVGLRLEDQQSARPPKALVRRILRGRRAGRGNFAGSDLEPWEFDVLATLRRAGAPYTLTPKSLAGTSMVGGAAMTHRVDKLLRRGLVSREVDPANRRQLLVTLTPEGLELVDRLIVDHIEGAERFLHGLDPSEVHALDAILRKLLLARGDTAPLDQG